MAIAPHLVTGRPRATARREDPLALIAASGVIAPALLELRAQRAAASEPMPSRKRRARRTITIRAVAQHIGPRIATLGVVTWWSAAMRGRWCPVMRR